MDAAAARRAQAAFDDAHENLDRYDALENQLVRRCLVRQGFTVFPPDSVAVPDSANGYHGILPPVAWAKENGLGMDPRKSPATPDSQSSTGAWANVSDDYKARLMVAQFGKDSEQVSYNFGSTQVATPTSGCSGRIRKSLWNDLRTYLRLSWIAGNQIRISTEDTVAHDSRVKDAVQSWRQCLRDGGYSVSSVEEAKDLAGRYYRDTAGDRASLDAARQREIALGARAATCGDSSHLRQADGEVTATAKARVLAQYEPDLLTWRQLTSRALSQAQVMLQPS